MNTPAHPIDIGIFAVFLLVTLVVGLLYGRKVKTMRDYALGGKNFSTSTLVATVVATWSSGSSLFIDIENTYSSGLHYIIAVLGMPAGLWITAQLATRMETFLNNVSIAEAMRDMYGKVVQMITAFCGIIAKLGYAAIQFKVMSTMLSLLFEIDSSLAVYIVAGIVILYSSLGGIRSVTFTDVVQFFTFGAIIPILALTVWNKVANPTKVLTTLTANPNFSFREVIGFTPSFLATLGFMGYFATPIGGGAPEIFQRIAMAKDTRQVNQVLTYSAGIFVLIFGITVWVAILILADNPGLAKGEVVPYMIEHYTYSGIRGLLGAGVMALGMSTADSCLNASSVLFSNDIVKPLTGQSQSTVINARLFSVIVGTLALLVALYSTDLLSLLLLSGSVYMPVFTVPMLMAVLGFRTSTRVVLIS
ncbi:MAG: sodium:solute symporter family protein, partial [Bacteroidota bacterium]